MRRRKAMALTNCPECKKEMSNRAGKCPHCGYQKRSVIIWTLGTLVALYFGLFVLPKYVFAVVEQNDARKRAEEVKAQQMLKESEEALREVQSWQRDRTNTGDKK